MISQTAEYALRAVVYLMQQDGAACTRAAIADGGKIPPDYLTRVMKYLSEQGIVSIRRGPGGGYRMQASEDELTVLDVVAAVEGVPRIKQCPLGLTGHEELCPLHAKLDEAAALVEQSFGETRVTDLIPTRMATTKRAKKTHCTFPHTCGEDGQ